MQLSNAVYVLAADARKMSHADELVPRLINDGHAGYFSVIAGEVLTHGFQEAAVDFIDDFNVAGKQGSEQGQGPALQRFRQEGVIGVIESPGSNIPRLFPAEFVFIHQQAHEFRYANGRVCVIELNRPLIVECPNATSCSEMDAHHILQCAGSEEVLLFQA